MVSKKALITGIVCAAMALVAYFAWQFEFFTYDTNSYTTTAEQLFTTDHLARLLPLALIGLLSALSIVACVALRKRLALKDPRRMPSAARGVSQPQRPRHRKRVSRFQVLRWVCMIGFFVFMVFGGILLGARFSWISIPVLSCPANMSQLTEASCYYLAHLDELASLPWTGVLTFLVSTLGFVLVFGRTLCGFLCPMGLAQDVMHAIRQKCKVEGIAMTDRMYQSLVPLRWTMLFLMMGLCFAGGNFCNFCPAISLSPIAAGLSVSLYASGFLMVFVLVAGFFKRRFFCTICPLGYLMGLAHKVQPFRIRKDCTACTECGACYEACPMGIKQIYTEREQTDVTDINCIMCGECVRCCPEDKALSLAFLGKGLYVSKRSRVVREFGGRNHG